MQVGPSVVEVCSKMEFFMHLIPIFLCHLVEKIPISIIWVKVQGMKHCNDHGGVLVKVAKLHKCTPCCHFHTRSIPHSFCIWVHFLGCISNVGTCNVVGWKMTYKLPMKEHSTQHTSPMLHHEGNDALKMVHVGHVPKAWPPSSP